MKVRELKNALSLMVPENAITKILTTISHWVKTLHEKPDFSTASEKEMLVLKKFAGLGIAEVDESQGKTDAKLTKSGKELYSDFVAHGYY